MKAHKKSEKQNKPWYRKPWGIALLVLSVISLTFPIPLVIIMWQRNKFSKAARVIVTVMVALIYIPAIAAISDDSSTQNNKAADQQQQAQAPQPTEQEEAEIEAAAEKIKKQLIEGYVPRYCQNHQQKRIPLPYNKDGNWRYDTENPTVGMTEQDCRNVITYLVNNVGSSAPTLESVTEGKISIGMNRHELLMSWGVPNDINSTHTAGGSSSQWVYGDPIYGANYVYLDDDIITAIQN